ncbi:helix-turn-helix transcriptional regulator [Streptomyces phytophilus]|uniref:helix-turn-helix transcriptional regulator n=1 Tax=Streptomyces phytophilus TaxID=722715 RepID=UPI001C69135D|nr:helix-turn-helix transcriptional regulator [Streptomyces phytophilus]
MAGQRAEHPDGEAELTASAAVPAHVLWHWATPQAEHVLARRDLAGILRFHRKITGTNQTALGELLGYDKTYISALELGKRSVDDIASRRRIAQCLGLPPHVLGVTDSADVDHRAMVQFGESTVRLAEIARQAGHAAEAVAELWPLVARLEARLAEGHGEREVLRLLAGARLGLGVALGNVLPEERLSTAARWTAKSLVIARRFDDTRFTCQVMRMHGNELRKSLLNGAAVDRLRRALALAPDHAAEAAVLPLLARAAGALGDHELFDQTLQQAAVLLEQTDQTSLFNPFALHEIRLRGLLATGRTRTAIQLAQDEPPLTTTAAPQWQVIGLITSARVHMAAGDPRGARDRLAAAVSEATRQRLPHQLQRILRTSRGALPDIQDAASTELHRLRREMAA